jgi:multidrug resistance efflux pump
MAVRLRKVEGYRRSLNDFKAEASEKKIIWKKVRFLTVIIFLIAACAFGYLFLIAKPSGIVFVNGNAFDLKTPVNAIVQWRIMQPGAKVKKGDLLFRLSVTESDFAAMQRNLGNTRLVVDRANIDLAEIDAKTFTERNNIREKEIELTMKAELAADALERGKIALIETESIYKSRKSDKEKAERLWHLEALTKSDLEAAQRMFAKAEGDYKKAQVFMKSLQTELDAAQKSLEVFKGGSKDSLDKLNQLIVAADKYTKKMNTEISVLKSAEDGKGWLLDVRSPIDGVVLNLFARNGEYVQQGNALLTIIDPASIELLGFFREKYKDKLKAGSKCKVKIGKDTFNSYIKYIKPELAPAPSRLKNLRVLSDYTSYIAVRLDASKMPQDIFYGQTGRAHIEELSPKEK